MLRFIDIIRDLLGRRSSDCNR